MEILQHTAALPGGSEQWAMKLVHHIAALPWDSGQCNSYCPRPHRLGALRNGSFATHCHTAQGQWGARNPAVLTRSAWGSLVVDLV